MNFSIKFLSLEMYEHALKFGTIMKALTCLIILSVIFQITNNIIDLVQLILMNCYRILPVIRIS